MKISKTLLVQIILLFLAVQINSQTIKQIDKMNISKLKYLDGSGNAYSLTKDSISYLPIKPEISSSGFYDGGNEVHKKIDVVEFQNTQLIFDEIFQNSGIHIKDRIKTSGVLIRYDVTNTMDEVIITKSEEQKKLEEYLKSLLKE